MNHTNSYHKVFHFPNGYGASVLCNPHASYGGQHGYFEVAVIHGAPSEWRIVYDTPITEDVVPNLCFAEVGEILEKIKKLPYRVKNEKEIDDGN
jgi:hypothetical protein